MITKDYHKIVYSRVPERDLGEFNKDLIECLKYLAIMSLTSGRRIVVTPEVDDVWHELIVQTKNYQDLCSWLPGKRFIHHTSITPAEYEEKVGEKEFVEEFLQWIPDYVNNFGNFTEEASNRWTVTQFLMEKLNMSIDDINRIACENKAKVSINQEWLEKFDEISRKISDY